jgi:Ser/Thr protein kinase RdoA (MazF antagonist)
MDRLNADTLRTRVEEHFREHARVYGLDPPAFAEPLRSPVHADLWLNNIQWAGRESWHLLDWDDVRIGDPAADLATLLGLEEIVRPEKERVHRAALHAYDRL